MNPIKEVTIAGTWDFTPEGGEKEVIEVPGGGWLKQGFSCEAGTYERYITIPAVGKPQVTSLELGAVNHLAEYYLGEDENNLKKIQSEVTAFTPQRVDLTPYVQPGKSYLLRIFVRSHKDGRARWNLHSGNRYRIDFGNLGNLGWRSRCVRLVKRFSWKY